VVSAPGVTERAVEGELAALASGDSDLQMMGVAVVLHAHLEETERNWEGMGYRKRVMED
jgi:hypothetical protein